MFCSIKPQRRFTNIDDVTQDHAHTRAFSTIALSVFSGTALHSATTKAVFLRRDLRQWADYYAHIALGKAFG